MPLHLPPVIIGARRSWKLTPRGARGMWRVTAIPTGTAHIKECWLTLACVTHPLVARQLLRRPVGFMAKRQHGAKPSYLLAQLH